MDTNEVNEYTLRPSHENHTRTRSDALDRCMRRLLASLNCLYYLSPRLRESVADWSESDSCLLSCIGVLIMPVVDDDDEQSG